MERFPTIQSLAEASLESVLTLVQGMGYYRRFKLLHQGAHYLLLNHSGVFPHTYEEVANIPGVGDYTSGAIMSIAFNQPYAATDGNVLRVLARLYGIKENIASVKERKKIHRLHQQNIEQATPNLYTQAVMELGALICRPMQPKCEQCPLSQTCVAYQKKETDLIPNIERKQVIHDRFFITYEIIRFGKLAFIQSQGPLLEGMYLLPQKEVKPFVKQSRDTLFTHQFSHQQWFMDLVETKDTKLDNLIWIPLDEIETIPIPQAHKKIVKFIVAKQKSV
jgi:A/G-specific adenine glycosylase